MRIPANPTNDRFKTGKSNTTAAVLVSVFGWLQVPSEPCIFNWKLCTLYTSKCQSAFTQYCRNTSPASSFVYIRILDPIFYCSLIYIYALEWLLVLTINNLKQHIECQRIITTEQRRIQGVGCNKRLLNDIGKKICLKNVNTIFLFLVRDVEEVPNLSARLECVVQFLTIARQKVELKGFFGRRG